MTTRKNELADTKVSAQTEDKTALTQETCPTRRLLLGAATLGGTAAAVAWRKPVIDAVLLPAHAQTTSGAPGGTGGSDPTDTGTDPSAPASTCPDFAVTASGSEAAGLSATSTGGVSGSDTTFYVVAYDASDTIVGSFWVAVAPDASGTASFSLTPAELDSAHGIKDLGGKTFQITVESAAAGCDGTPPSASVFIAGGASGAAFTVGASSAAGDGGANLESCGSVAGTFVEFTITVKNKTGTPMGAGVTRNAIVQADGCTLPIAYTFAELDADFGPTEPYDICIDGLNDASDADTTTIVL